MRAVLTQLALFAVLANPAIAAAQRPLPPLHDGAVVAGPGEFRHDGELLVQGKVRLNNMTLDLHGPIRVAANATLELNDVRLNVSDPDGAPNGTSGLTCDGAAHVIVRRSTMTPVGSAHPMWFLQGELDVDGFTTLNSEFHLKRVQARLNQLKIFELEISDGSQVTARGLDLVFLSTHSGDGDHLHFANIPVDRAFTQNLDLGSGAHAQLTDSRMQMFLLYVHGHSEATLAHMDRVQLALFPDCDGTLRLPRGRLGTAAKPAVFPDAKSSNCPFHISLDDVNVDTWDIYTAGHARLTVEDSQIDELIAGEHATVAVSNSNLYADWLAVSGDASMTVENGIVGALRLVKQRPDLATSQIRVSGRGRAVFSGVRFDCGIVAADDANVDINRAAVPPKYARHSGNSVIRMNGDTGYDSR
ncbi:MAG: hypothetical protein WBE76_19955 [Terracidiphilus sp.]